MATIVVDHVWKQFMLRRDRADSVGQLLTRMIPKRRRKAPAEPFWALKDISLNMPAGTSFGIVGNNGSGKSTLLKILTRTMSPTRGHIHIEGRVSALVELGAGFHPDFTGRENVYLNASILGISRRAIEKKMDDIIDFAEIRPFIDTPVKYYSSGMHARLGFAVATSVEPEILIVDEVLAVGDEAFQQKCMDRIFHMKREGTSILLVSHDLSSIERLMDQAIWINKGVMQKSGLPRDVVLAYRQSVLDHNPQNPVEEFTTSEAKRDSEGPLQLQQAFVRSRDKIIDTLLSGDSLNVVIVMENHGHEAFRGHLSLALRRPDGLEIASFSTLLDGTPIIFPQGTVRVSLNMPELYLTAGQYEMSVTLYDDNGRRLREWPAAIPLAVQSMARSPGLLVLPHTWQVE
ncbi:polysaccharide ABC transporter ATP-binding protein [Sulfobacillus thermosulfidooxidans]|uniref:ABC transporter ATP-binding protein n=1 Tax=Sulfobacillus thermosulfidooxidans TaxID=28034 RepID=UPI00096B6EC4|nr:polysaccharide ABC transporter ATP-binding protein [Sulfobacillus thermosulfidooxidans]OLZ11727.1 polysaccharide/polyol phosphate ABC transporter ATP-binding protein [Sulfobacillus thermosulfidooxidans]OLZ18690.1 polysaccharide/polyol phosphate ABC transporter ATP-binding protein [Sulfobacillus thermosulfidooxidans]OLZ20231.1 polysaccharide/polyol phosphate ABC transporter ATP-binding protein [Sulfobacillus thermosulfidooxidans]